MTQYFKKTQFYSKITVLNNLLGGINMDFNNLFQESFELWGLEEWLIVGVGALLLLIILFIILKPRKQKHTPYKAVHVQRPAVSVEPTKVEPVEPVTVDEPKPSFAEKKSEKILLKKEAEPEAKVKPVAETKSSTEEKPKTDKVVRYHVAQNKDDTSEFKGQWRVRKEGSKKTIKYFKTQAEAIKYAETLADNNDTSIVIHKRDGSIRKQDYSSKKSSK